MSGLIRRTACVAALLVSTVASAAPSAPAPSQPTMAAPNSTGPSLVKPDATAPGARKPDVAALLFDTPQWALAPVGSKLRYSFEKTSADPAFGPAFKDDVVLTLGAGDDAESRTTEMQLFSGANRKPAGPFRSDKQNPILLVILENNVQELSKLFQANPRYLKNAIRKAWRDAAKIDTAMDTVDGKAIAVTRIAISPFVGDLESDRMKGLSAMTYLVDVSPEVPGSIVSVDIRTEDGGKTRFSETLRYVATVAP